MAKIKICGLSRKCDIDYVNEAAPDYCGFVIDCPKSIRNVSIECVRELLRGLDTGIIPVGVFVDEPIDTIAAIIREGLFDHVQLHGGEDDEYIKMLREEAGCKITVIKAFSVTDAGSVSGADLSFADYILFDNGGGGTGQSFDWDILKAAKRPFFLAGGLNPDNIKYAALKVMPYAFDLSSGVETNGKKDREKILAAVQAVRAIG